MSKDPITYRLDEVLIRPDGTRRSPEEAAKLVGWRGVWLAQLGESLLAVQRQPRPLSSPTRIFVSYRWGTEGQNEWVADLVMRLRALGNFVLYDRDLQREGLQNVPELVALIASVHVFLAVIDPGYVERTVGTESGTIQDGWVFDEWQTALLLEQHGKLKIFGLLRAGNEAPPGFRPVLAGGADDSWCRYRGNTYVVSDPDSLDAGLRKLFGNPGLTLPQYQWDRANTLYGQSQQALAAGEFDTARRVARQLADEFPQISDGFAQLAQVAFAVDDHANSLSAARHALKINPGLPDVLSYAGLSAYMVGRHEEAVSYGAAALWARRDDPIAHYAIGNAFDELLQPYPALAHFEIAREKLPAAQVHNDAGMAYRRAGQPRDALRCFEEGLRLPGADDNLRINAVAAAIEAEDSAAAEAHLKELSPRSPAHPLLTQKIQEWQQSGAAPTALVPQLKPRTPVGTVTCSKCKAYIPLISDKELLCARCGAELIGDIEPCRYCGHDGIVAPALGDGALTWGCPYCCEGRLKFSRIV